MGWPSLNEDTVERYIQSGAQTELAYMPTQASAPRPKLKYCPLCMQGYLEESSLDRHVARDHGKQHLYLKVNDRIVREMCWLKGKLTKCDLIIIGVPSTEVEIEFDGVVKRCSISSSKPSLIGQLPSGGVEGLIRVKAHGNPLAGQFRIYLGRQPEFRPQAMDGAFADLMIRMRRSRTELAGFRAQWSHQALNELEERYFNGILDYCHGWQLEEEGRHDLARDRLEAAMNLLIPFNTDLAEEVRSALALRMNIFGGSWGCEESSPFFAAEVFFCGQDNLGVGDVPTRSVELLIGSFSTKILEAISAYYGENDRAVFAIINDLRPRDRNDEDKISLIRARTRLRTGDREAAVAAYESLLDHPLFGEEASKVVKAAR